MAGDEFANLTPVHTPQSRYFSASEFEGQPIREREWTVPRIIPSGGAVTGLGAGGAVGKTQLMLQLSTAIVLGQQWLGQSVVSGSVVYFSAEETRDEMQRRLDDQLRTTEHTFADLDRLWLGDMAGEDAFFQRQDRRGIMTPTRAFVELREMVLDVQPVLVVIDGRTDTFGGNENDRRDVIQYVNPLRGLAREFGGSIVVLQHPSQSGERAKNGLSGNTAWQAAYRQHLSLDRIEVGNGEDTQEVDPTMRILRVQKSNYGPGRMELKIKLVDGRFELVDQVGTGLDRMAASEKAKRLFLTLLRAWAEDGRTVSDRSGAAFAPARFAEDPRSEGVTSGGFKMAMLDLFARGQLRVEEAGPPSKRRRVIVEVAPNA